MATIPLGSRPKPMRSYNLLEREVIPEFYTRNQRWHSHRHGLCGCGKHRAVDTALSPRTARCREYTEQHYLPAAASYRDYSTRCEHKGAIGKQVVDWDHTDWIAKWGSSRFGDLRVETNEGHHVFEIEIFLNDFDPNAARLQLYADGINGSAPSDRR